MNNLDNNTNIINSNTDEQTCSDITLQLGDVITISDATNDILNNNTFIIEYIDDTKIRLVNIDNFLKTTLLINSDGSIKDNTINCMNLLSRNKFNGYARQNGLVIGVWVNIYFGGELPTIITGEIINLEEDMIEIKTYPDKDIIYINFAYHGIPEDIPIETFEVRPPPLTYTEQVVDAVHVDDAIVGDDITYDESDKAGDNEERVDVEEVKHQIKQLLIEADQLHFGDIMGQVKEVVAVDKDKFRYNIDVQSNDMLEEFISTIPNYKRTSAVLNNIHIMISRFIQLRQMSSKFDNNKNVIGVIQIDDDSKPLADYLSGFKNKLFWLLFVAKNVKKVYNMDYQPDDIAHNVVNDVIDFNSEDDLNELAEIFTTFRNNINIEGRNKYIELYNSLNGTMTPFDKSNDDSDVIISGKVEDNINAVIDSLGDLYSSVVANETVTTKKFIIQKYNLGLDALHASKFTGSNMIATRVKLVPNDEIAIKSIITLPEPTVRFSQINLPGSNMLVKSNLNLQFLNYWQLIKQNTQYNDVIIDNLNNDIDYNTFNFVDNIKHYMLNINAEQNKHLSKLDIYNAFLKIIIPKTQVLFNIVKKYIKGKLTIIDIVYYLEPFMIYSNDITYNQYLGMTAFIQEQIRDYNRLYVELGRSFSLLKSIRNGRKYINPLFQILSSNSRINHDIFGIYGYVDAENTSSSTFIKKITMDDYGALFNTAISLENLHLMFSKQMDTLLNINKDNQDNQESQIDTSLIDTCKTYIVAKKYYSLLALEDDNAKTIYFDKKYDDTDYTLIDKYIKQKSHLSVDEFELFLIDALQQKYNYDNSKATYLANTLINGAKEVVDGQHAFLTQETDMHNIPEDSLIYFIRQNNMWVKDESVDPKWFITDADVLCNIQTDCLFKSDTNVCESLAVSKETIANNALKQILDQFDQNYILTKDDLSKQINDSLLDYLNRYELLKTIRQHNFYKHNNIQYNIGLTITSVDKLESPYLNLRDIIIGQMDFVKKQYDIVKFVMLFTRPGDPSIPNISDGEMETVWWLYCKKTNVKLLPTFVHTMATAFINNHNTYGATLDIIIKEIGKLSDDGDNWVDKNSGWTICPIDFDVEEGFDDGFKITSRGVLVENVDVTIVNAISSKRLSIEGQMIYNVINTIATNIGIDMLSQYDFIIKIVTELMADINIIEKEGAYKQRAELAVKKLPEYLVIYNSTLMFLTLGMFLISMQTSIPSIKTRKTYPGCIRSFSGFPIDGTGDFSGLNYLSCVVAKLKNSAVPWNVISKLKEDKLNENTKHFIVKYLLPYSAVEHKINEKIQYLLVNPVNDVPDEHNISKWTNFLPPLKRFQINKTQNISSTFESTLLDELKRGDNRQHVHILVIESKIIGFSLLIQDLIQQIVDKKELLLKSSTHPYIDNSCCNETTTDIVTTLQYFIKENGEIKIYNDIVFNLTNILRDVTALTNASMFLSLAETRRPTTIVSNDFSESTIYLGFIKLCHFYNLIPLSENLQRFCQNKPQNISQFNTLDDNIMKMKRDGINYSKEQFTQLLQVSATNNIVDVNIIDTHLSQQAKLNKAVNLIEDLNETIISPKLIEHFKDMFETYDASLQEDNLAMRKIKNYLGTSTGQLRNNILDFIKRKSKIKKNEYKKISDFITNLKIWQFDNDHNDHNDNISDDGMYNCINYYKTCISLISVVFPTTILNEQIHAIQPHKYWGLSNKHNNDIKTIIDDCNKPLKNFYDNKHIVNILLEIPTKCAPIALLAEATPAFSDINNRHIITYNIFNKQVSTLLFEYYILQIFNEYINLTTDIQFVNKMVNDNSTEPQDTFAVEQELKYSETDDEFVKGDISNLQQNVANLLVEYINVLMNTKKTINMSYSNIMDKVFKLKEAEKDTFTDRLDELSKEERAADTMLKINKLGVWSKGLEKGLKEYDPENYDNEKAMADKIASIERNIRRTNKNVTDDNIGMYVDDALEENEADNLILDEELSMGHMNEDYNDGDYYAEDNDDANDYE